ncbi:MAG: SDR family NAD(P)-dependent oxidoreductase [Phycisphaerales bacterium]|nr:MAG: SDR family NAD(P)-dependent oxidoreductase [Phycisphaerales bacterium]
MTADASERARENRLARITPIVRGLLAEKTGDQDIPYQPVILKSLTTPEALVFAASAGSAEAPPYPAPLAEGRTSPLVLDVEDSDAPPEHIRKHLAAEIAAYSQQHGAKPQILPLGELGVLYVEQSDPRPDMPLWNRVALVTGAAGAIGYGICRGLLEKGAHVAATDLPGPKLDTLAVDLARDAPQRVTAIPIDVTDADSVSRGFNKAILTWGGLDIVVVNAGIATVWPLSQIDIEAFRRLEKVNVEGALLTLSETARHFILQATGGDIIVVSTKNVPSPGAGFGAYSATKAACHQLGRIASIELAQYGVRVNMVAPDAVFAEGKYRSGLWEQIGPERMQARGLDEAQLQEYYRGRNLLKSRITGRHVANAVLFFATRQTPTTGATIPVDGGLPDATPR